MKQLLITIAALVLVGCGPSVDIHKAAEEGNISIIKQYLDDGWDVDANDSFDRTPLHRAAFFGQKEVAKLLIANGADVNAKDEWKETPLHEAAVLGHTEITELLIAKGADVNAKNNWKETPLDIATNPENPIDTAETADFLRKRGAKTGEELKAAGN